MQTTLIFGGVSVGFLQGKSQGIPWGVSLRRTFEGIPGRLLKALLEGFPKTNLIWISEETP